MNEPEQVDLVVIGAGMSGLRAASVAARSLRVLVLEKLDEVGGSARLSAGMFWLPPTMAAYDEHVPHGDRRLAAAVLAAYDDEVAQIRASGVFVAEEPHRQVMGWGRGYSTDIRPYLLHMRDQLIARGGTVLTDAGVTEVERRGGHFLVRFERGGAVAQVVASAVVLATGGFQGSAALRAELLPQVGPDILVRSNPGSRGDGLRFGRSLGAAEAGDTGSFYGHLIPHPIASWSPEQFFHYSIYFSSHAVLVVADGRRVSDESRGDELLNQDLAGVPGMRGFVIFDESVRSSHALSEPFPNFVSLDRLRYAMDAGARHAVAPTFEELADRLAGFGVDREQLLRTLRGDTTRSFLASRLERAPLPEAGQLAELRTPPYYALEVQPSITFTMGGLAVDTTARVLGGDGAPIPGLYAIGCDIGGLSSYGYAGGLAPAHITGTAAGRDAVRYVHSGSAPGAAVG
ncbi:FAD-binding protein [Compostimonas suwonensis]|uniref:Putative flavoprotein YhiN n=1 Tax=Compostimonas suwonensis TaxID=1048394 RepID=A0A2M9C0A0_9MICO|nr:FAD-binding protein [Compostimonas suwonensis]PJJ63761.1 putative flavoprotein YhiN [Compostimonas suwonensis]